MTEDQLREAMAASVPQHQRPRKFMPRTNGGQERRINHAKVVDLSARGMTHRQIAAAVFCEIGTVANILRTHRLRGDRA